MDDDSLKQAAQRLKRQEGFQPSRDVAEAVMKKLTLQMSEEDQEEFQKLREEAFEQRKKETTMPRAATSGSMVGETEKEI